MDVRDGGALPLVDHKEEVDFIELENNPQEEETVEIHLDNEIESQAFLDMMVGSLVKYLNTKDKVEEDYFEEISKTMGRQSMRHYITLPCK